MALTTNADAHAVNRLAEFLLHDRGRTDKEAVNALAHLADAAYRKLGAGINGDQVRAAWLQNPPAQDNRNGT